MAETKENKLALIEEKEWFNKLIEEIQGKVLEIKNLSWSAVVNYHVIGKLIIDAKPTFVEQGYTMKEMMQILSEQVGRSERTLYRTTQFFEKYPDLTASPYTEEVNWFQIVKDLSKKEPKQLGDGEKEEVKFEASKETEPENPMSIVWDKKLEKYVLTISDPEKLDLIEWGDSKDILLSYLENQE